MEETQVVRPSGQKVCSFSAQATLLLLVGPAGLLVRSTVAPSLIAYGIRILLAATASWHVVILT